MSVGAAAVAHLTGDADGVLAALEGTEAVIHPTWLPVVSWLRSVARRQLGDLAGARRELESVTDDGHGTLDRNQLDLANWRIDWLAGDVERVCRRLAGLCEHYRVSGDEFFYVQTMSELAAHEAWLGRRAVAAELLETTIDGAQRMPGSLVHVLRTVATVAIAVDRGADEEAAAIIRDETAAPTFGADRWYWRDRGAMALIHVFAPSILEVPPRAAAHRSAAVLGRAMRDLREGDTSTVASLTWPSAGVTRANLPQRWLFELCAAGIAVGNPPPAELLGRFDAEIRLVARRLAASTDDATHGSAVKALHVIPPPPRAVASIDVLGPLDVRLGGVLVDHPHLHRQRVRELLTTLVVRRRVRRAEVAADLWPELSDAAHNLRVTLNYLQQVLQPTRHRSDLPYFVRSEGGWLTLVDNPRLSIDLWELNQRFDAAEQSDRGGDPQAAIDQLEAALPLWRDNPLIDLPDTDWALAARTHLIQRYGSAATRKAELELAAGRHADAMRSAAFASERRHHQRGSSSRPDQGSSRRRRRARRAPGPRRLPHRPRHTGAQSPRHHGRAPGNLCAT